MIPSRFDNFDFFLGEIIQRIHQPINCPIRHLDLALVGASRLASIHQINCLCLRLTRPYDHHQE